VPRRVESVITAHVALPPASAEALCGTAFVGAHSFALELPLTGALDLGRGADADVQLVSSGVSRVHARMTMTGERAIVEDLGSRNGTFVNRAHVVAPVDVGHGDEIGIGDARFALLRKSALPADVVPVLVRRAFLDRVNAEIARGARPFVFVLQLPDRWYEIAAARELCGRLAKTAHIGLYADHILAFAVRAPKDEGLTIQASSRRALRLAAIETLGGTSDDAAPDADADELLNAALKALLSAIEDEEPAREQPIVLDPAMQLLHEEARRIAASPIAVLLVGETGVGKEIFARAIHQGSGRTGPLVALNAAALPEQLLESELFGHEKGAFSGAAGAKAGLIEAAHGGTLFLDEIGELPMPMQAKLLRVLEDHTVRRVGATTERKIDVRVVAATNCDLEQCVAEKRFRQDLLFRLNGCTLFIPPLRERTREIARLAEVFLSRAAAQMNAPQLRLTPEAVQRLEHHAWPGNVRELRNVIERAAALCARTGEAIAPSHLPTHLGQPQGQAASARPHARSTVPVPADAPAAAVRDAVRDLERERIVEALRKTGGNQTQAAEILGLPRRTLAYKMARLGIRTK
jgi:DNA-binding NtrC family response regulator